MLDKSGILARSGVEWIPFSTVGFSLFAFLFVFTAKAMKNTQYGMVLLLVALFLLIIAILALFMLKEIVLYSEYVSVQYAFRKEVLKLQYADIEYVQHFQSVIGSGPNILVQFKSKNPPYQKRIRFGLRRDRERVISILKDHGVRVNTH